MTKIIFAIAVTTLCFFASPVGADPICNDGKEHWNNTGDGHCLNVDELKAFRDIVESMTIHRDNGCTGCMCGFASGSPYMCGSAAVGLNICCQTVCKPYQGHVLCTRTCLVLSCSNAENIDFSCMTQADNGSWTVGCPH